MPWTTVGALVGGLILACRVPRSEGWAALAGLGVYAAAPVSLALDAPVPVAVYVVVGLGIEVFNVPWFTATQREVPADRLTRVSSLAFVVSFGLALMAPVIDRFGLDPVLWDCA